MRYRWISRQAAMLLTAALLAVPFAGCNRVPGQPASSSAETSATTAPDYPVTVNGITLAAAPARVAVLAPSLAEMAADLGYGDRLCGRSAECDYPDTVAALPVVGSMLLPDMDTLAGLQPDLVLLQTEPSQEMRRRLLAQNVQLVVIPPAAVFEEIQAVYAQLGEALGGAVTGRARAAFCWSRLTDRLAALSARIPESTARAALYVASADGCVATGDTVAHTLLEKAGLLNAAADGTDWMLPAGAAAQAEVIFAPATLTATVAGMAAYKNSPAVKNRRIYGLDPMTVERQSLRMADAVENMLRQLYPADFTTTAASETSSEATVPSGSANETAAAKTTAR